MLWWTLKGTLILALALAATTLLRRRPAAVRHAVWTVAVAAQLLLPLGSRFVTQPALSVAVPARMTAVTTPVEDRRSRLSGRAGEGGETREAGQAGLPVLHLSWVLGAGSALLALRLFAGTWRIAAISRGAQRVHDGEWLSLCGQLCEALGIARPVTLLRTDRVSLPVTWGFVYPVILLPAESGGWPEALRRHVLLHELAHVRRGDAWSQLVAQGALALFWFNPLLWLSVRRMRAEAEHACDDYVLREGERPSHYASSLVRLVHAHEGRAVPPFAALSVGSRSDLEERVAAITHPLRDASVRRVLFAGAIGVALAIVLPLSALHPKRERPREAARAAVPELDCGPVFIDGSDFREMSGTLTANGRTTHYFFLRPEPGRCLEASFSLGARFTSDDGDLVPTPGLDALVREVVPGLDRTLYLTAGGGTLQRRFLVNGRESEWDPRARNWYSGVLPDVIRRTYAGSADRARRIVERGGVGALFEEVGRMESVDVRERYLEELLALRDPDALPRRDLLRVAGPLLEAYTPTWAHFLAAVVMRDGSREDVRQAVLDELRYVEPEIERGPVLRALGHRERLR